MYNLSGEKKATRDGFGTGILKLGQDRKNVVVLGASVGDSTRAFKFKEKYPERYIEAGIAEANMIGMSAGLALAGKVPYPTSFATFLPGRCYDQIRQSACYSNLPIKLVATHAGLSVGADGATHQMMEDIAMMRATPNIDVVVPADATEAEKATIAVYGTGKPAYLRLGREKVPMFTDQSTPFEIGKAVELKHGPDAAIIACGLMVYHALMAAQELEEKGISVSVVNMHTIKPIDVDAIKKAAKTGAIVTAEEHQINGGLGGAVAEVLVEHDPIRMKRVGMQDQFGESGNSADLLKKYGLTHKEIVEAVLELLKK